MELYHYLKTSNLSGEQASTILGCANTSFIISLNSLSIFSKTFVSSGSYLLISSEAKKILTSYLQSFCTFTQTSVVSLTLYNFILQSSIFDKKNSAYFP